MNVRNYLEILSKMDHFTAPSHLQSTILRSSLGNPLASPTTRPSTLLESRLPARRLNHRPCAPLGRNHIDLRKSPALEKGYFTDSLVRAATVLGVINHVVIGGG